MSYLPSTRITEKPAWSCVHHTHTLQVSSSPIDRYVLGESGIEMQRNKRH